MTNWEDGEEKQISYVKKSMSNQKMTHTQTQWNWECGHSWTWNVRSLKFQIYSTYSVRWLIYYTDLHKGEAASGTTIRK